MIESRGLFKQRSQREQCSYHLSAGKITWPCWAGLSFWQLHREFIQTLAFLRKTLAQGVWREHWHVCFFWFSVTRACQHIQSARQVFTTNTERLNGKESHTHTHTHWTHDPFVVKSLFLVHSTAFYHQISKLKSMCVIDQLNVKLHQRIMYWKMFFRHTCMHVRNMLGSNMSQLTEGFFVLQGCANREMSPRSERQMETVLQVHTAA